MSYDHDEHEIPASELRAWAAGSYGDEAAVELLIAHRVWLAQRDFRRACLTRAGGYAWFDAELAARIADGDEAVALPASSSELRILAIAAHLASHSGHRSLGDLLTGLDASNVRLVLDAVAHTAGWHEQGLTHTVTGRRWTS